MPTAPAALDTFRLDAMTPEPEDLDTVAPNSAAMSPPQPHCLSPGSQPPASGPGPGDLEEELRSRLSQLVKRANSKDDISAGEEWPADRQADKDSDRQREKKRLKDADRERQRASERLREKASETVEQVNGQEMKRSERLTKSPSVREWRVEKGVECVEESVHDQEQTRGDRREANRQSKKQHKRDVEKEAAQKGGGGRRSGSSASSPAVTPSSQEGALSDNQVRGSKEKHLFPLLTISFYLCSARVCPSVCSLIHFPPSSPIHLFNNHCCVLLLFFFAGVCVCVCVRRDRTTRSNSRGSSCSPLSCSRWDIGETVKAHCDMCRRPCSITTQPLNALLYIYLSLKRTGMLLVCWFVMFQFSFLKY